jgi:hypothetical protein
MREYIGVSVWDSRIQFGSWSYEGQSDGSAEAIFQKFRKSTVFFSN